MPTSTEPPPGPPVRLDKFKLTVRMDATLSVVGTGGEENWVKPGAEGGMTWKGYEFEGQWVNPVPTLEQIKTAFQMIQLSILTPVLDELIAVSQRKIAETQQYDRR